LIPASVIVLTKNEEENVRKCLDSVREFQEVFVVDSASTDRTVEIARGYANVRVVPFQWDGKFPKKKQWALDNVPLAADWVLMLDADEEATPELAREIGERVRDPGDKDAFFVGYDNFFLGRRLRHGLHTFKLILFRKGAALFHPDNELLVQTMWEVEGNYQPEIRGAVGRCKARAIHNDCKTLYHYFHRHNRYSDLEAVLRHQNTHLRESYPPLRRRLKRLSLKLPGAGLLYFFYSYVFKLGFLDGRAGLAFAMARMCYVLQLECKISELTLEPDKLESHYLVADS